MRDSRRAFLTSTLTAVAAAGFASLPAAAQQTPEQERPIVPPSPRFDRPMPQAQRDPKFLLKANQASIKKDFAKLSQLVADLQKGLSDNDTTEVLSMGVIRKTEEIEKLAKQIRELIRGY